MNIREKTINTKFLPLLGSEKCAGRDTSDTTPPPRQGRRRRRLAMVVRAEYEEEEDTEGRRRKGHRGGGRPGVDRQLRRARRPLRRQRGRVSSSAADRGGCCSLGRRRDGRNLMMDGESIVPSTPALTVPGRCDAFSRVGYRAVASMRRSGPLSRRPAGAAGRRRRAGRLSDGPRPTEQSR